VSSDYKLIYRKEALKFLASQRLQPAPAWVIPVCFRDNSAAAIMSISTGREFLRHSLFGMGIDSWDPLIYHIEKVYHTPQDTIEENVSV